MQKQYCERCKYFNSEKYCIHPMFEDSKPPVVKPKYVCLLFEGAIDFVRLMDWNKDENG